MKEEKAQRAKLPHSIITTKRLVHPKNNFSTEGLEQNKLRNCQRVLYWGSTLQNGNEHEMKLICVGQGIPCMYTMTVGFFLKTTS